MDEEKKFILIGCNPNITKNVCDKVSKTEKSYTLKESDVNTNISGICIK
jgi:hypothetical protein